MTEPVSETGGLVAAHPLADIARDFWQPAPELVGKLPRVTCRDCSDRTKNCTKHSKQKCQVCDAYISTAHIHLDYVGHPDVNRTLTEIDPAWNWEPFALDADGLPYIRIHERTAQLWGRLTLHGVPRICVGSCENSKSDRDKELVGDLIRNGAMRHNVFGGLWSKVERDTPKDDDAQPAPSRRRSGPPVSADGEPLATKDQKDEFVALCDAAEMDKIDRAEFVKAQTGRTAWKDVLKLDAGHLIEVLKADGWETVRRGDGGWEAHPAGSDAPFMDAADEPVGFPLSHDEHGVAIPDEPLTGPALARSAAKGAKTGG